MLRGYSTKTIVFIALMGTLMFTLSFALGSALIIITSNPAGSGFTSALIQPIMIVIALLIVRRFGVATLMYLVYGVLALPTNMVGGFPGPLKILIVLLMGLPADIFSRLGKYRKGYILLGLIAMYVILIPLMIYLYTLLGIPGGEKFIQAAPIFTLICFTEGVIGWFIGIKVYNKIKEKSFVKQLTY